MDRQLVRLTGSPVTGMVRYTSAGLVSLVLALSIITAGAMPASAANNISAPAASVAPAGVAAVGVESSGQESMAAARWIYYGDYYSSFDCQQAGYNKLLSRVASNYRCVYVSRGHWVAWALYLLIS
jgi:hypothetical protein